MQEKKGYFFNRDKDKVFDILESLQVNKERYGYMACPCRLATGDREKTRILFALANTVNRMWRNMEAVIAIFMYPKNGIRIKCPTNMFLKDDLRKRVCFKSK